MNMPTSLCMSVHLKSHPLSWSEHFVSVVHLHCPEEERPVLRAVLSADKKHAGTLRKEILVKR